METKDARRRPTARAAGARDLPRTAMWLMGRTLSPAKGASGASSTAASAGALEGREGGCAGDEPVGRRSGESGRSRW
jgi:hypothetical protein